MTRYPDDDLFLAMLGNVWSNADSSQARVMANELAAMVLGDSYEVPRRHVEISADPASYDPYVDEYTGKDSFAIVREGRRLMMQIPPR